jgi:hypothetical protein
MASQQRQFGPSSKSRSDGKSIVIRRRELISSVVGQTAFTVIKYSVNPGIAATFPLLSIQAPQWEQYRFLKLAFEYITRTATTTIGSVIMAPDYDAEDPAPISEAQLTGYQGAVEDAPWKNITCIVDCKSVTPGPRKFIRSAAIAGDIKVYDACNFFFGVVDMTGNSGIGKLWVDYEVELSVPQNSPVDDLYPKRTSFFTRAAVHTFTTTVNEPLNYDAAAVGNDPLGIGADVAGVYTPPAGVYKVEFGASFADSANEDFTVVVTSFKNGIASGPSSTMRSIDSAAGIDYISGTDLIRMNGTDTFQVMVNLTGAAGILTYVTGTGHLLWSHRPTL